MICFLCAAGVFWGGCAACCGDCGPSCRAAASLCSVAGERARALQLVQIAALSFAARAVSPCCAVRPRLQNASAWWCRPPLALQRCRAGRSVAQRIERTLFARAFILVRPPARPGHPAPHSPHPPRAVRSRCGARAGQLAVGLDRTRSCRCTAAARARPASRRARGTLLRAHLQIAKHALAHQLARASGTARTAQPSMQAAYASKFSRPSGRPGRCAPPARRGGRPRVAGGIARSGRECKRVAHSCAPAHAAAVVTSLYSVGIDRAASRAGARRKQPLTD